MTFPRLAACLTLTTLCTAQAGAAQTAGGSSGVTEHVSKDGAGGLSTGTSTAPSISDDGRWVAFYSFGQLLPEDTNPWADVYAYDRWTDTLVGVSLDSTGTGFGNAPSYFPAISADGRYVAFETGSDNMVPNDFNTWVDIYVRDLQTGVTVRASSNAAGFAANGGSWQASISDDGRYVAFQSSADDLVLPDTNLQTDIFRRDLLTGAIVRVSDGPLGEGDGHCSSPSISGDGSRIAFESLSSNLVPGDLLGFDDVFVTDVGGLPVLVTRTPGGLPANSSSDHPEISADGQYVAYSTWATDIQPVTVSLNVFRFDVAALQNELVSLNSNGVSGDDKSHAPQISSDGRYVAWESEATNLAPFQGAGWNAFLRDVDLGLTWTVGRPSGVTSVPNHDTGGAVMTGDATTVAFVSLATNIVPGVGAVNQREVYVRTLHPDPMVYCASSITPAGCQPSLSTSGFPSVAAAAGFSIDATDVPNQKSGLLFYGLAGPAAKPFAGATLCVAGVKKRTPVLQSGGNPPAANDCSGSYSIDMNAFAAGALGGSPHAALGLVGQQVNAQIWGRAGAGVFLTDAAQYVVGP